jgi:methylmalonyl-CoA/ethylmalonyl-CoA epimerase
MIKVKRIDHVGIAVPSLGEARSNLTSIFGLTPSAEETVAAQGTDVLFLHAAGTEQAGASGAALELICPNGNESLARFVDKRGQALHHVCYEVEDLAGALAALAAAGVPLIDQAPRRGARGHNVAFLHPRATGGVLFELCEKAESEGESR